MGAQPRLLNRTLSSLVAAYPFERGRTRLRSVTHSFLVGHLPFGPWVRVSGLTDAEWRFLEGERREDPTAHLMLSLLRPGSVFVDVGANVGYYTLLAASLGAKVTAYEPTPAVFARLQENVALNGLDATLVNAAVMDKPGTLELHLSSDDPEANSVFGDGEAVRVPAVTLGDVGRADLMKIDAEGAEPFVLDGARALLAGADAPTLIVEVNTHTLRASGFAPEDVYARLEGFGYAVEMYEQGMYMGEMWGNVLAVKTKARTARVFCGGDGCGGSKEGKSVVTAAPPLRPSAERKASGAAS